MADSDLLDDLRATAESARRTAAELVEIEDQKAILAPDDPRTLDLSRRALELGERLRDDTRAEHMLVEQVSKTA